MHLHDVRVVRRFGARQVRPDGREYARAVTAVSLRQVIGAGQWAGS